MAGNDVGFEAPFNSLSAYVEEEDKALVAKRREEEENAKYEGIEIPEMLERLAKVKHAMATLVVRTVGGDADGWDDLSTRVKLNYVAVCMGWKGAEEAAEKIKNEDL